MGGYNSKVIVDKVLDFPTKSSEQVIDGEHALLYFLGITTEESLKDGKWNNYLDLNLIGDNKIFPLYQSIAHHIIPYDCIVQCPGIPKFWIWKILHAEQKTIIYKQLKSGTKLYSDGKISNIIDKKKGALITFEFRSYDNEKRTQDSLVCINQSSAYLKGKGGFRFKGRPENTLNPPQKPEGDCTYQFEEITQKNQALLYRLNWDKNPLHVDWRIARLVGYKKPILHGMCIWSITGRIIITHLLNKDETRLTSIYLRFVSHVFPGETLIIKAWKISEGHLYLEVSTQERKIVTCVGDATYK